MTSARVRYPVNRGLRDLDPVRALDRNLKAVGLSKENRAGPVDQSGMIAAFARRKPRVQIPLGPPLTRFAHT
jgi:hypothetical protein